MSRKPTTLTKNTIQGKFLSRGFSADFEFESVGGDYWFGTDGHSVYKNWTLYPGPIQLIDENGNEVHFVGREVGHLQGIRYVH